MGDCRENEALELAALRERQAGVLRVVLVASLTMFAIACLFLRTSVTVVREALSDLSVSLSREATRPNESPSPTFRSS